MKHTIGVFGIRPKTLWVGSEKVDELYEIHQIMPELLPSGLNFIIAHERGELASSASEQQSQVNLRAIASYFDEPGMTVEKLEEDIAAAIWLTMPQQQDRYCTYLNKYYLWLKNGIQDEITKKIFRIDNEYRARYQKVIESED